jgi:hypothetical protein
VYVEADGAAALEVAAGAARVMAGAAIVSGLAVVLAWWSLRARAAEANAAAPVRAEGRAVGGR